MAKEFGVKICLDIPKYAGKSISSIEYKIEIPNLGINKFVPKILPKTDGSNESETNWEDTGKQDYLNFPKSNEKFYVAPESEEIFLPKEGLDFGIIENEDSSYDGVEVFFDNKFLVGGRWYLCDGSGELPEEEYKNVKIKLRGYDTKEQFFAAKMEGKE